MPGSVIIELPTGETIDDVEYADRCVREWAGMGPDGVPSLIKGLAYDRDSCALQIRAAEALGEVDDERVVPALLEAFRSSFLGRSSRLTLALGILSALVSALYFLTLVVPKRGATGVLMYLAVGCVALWWLIPRRRYSSHVTQALTAALLRQAERHPSPELTTILRDLKIVTIDRWNQNRGARETAREAHARLTTLTGDSATLPVIADSGIDDALPVPSSAAEPDPQSLPRVR